MKFREKLYRFMQGRNGVDELSKFLSRVSFGVLILAIVFSILTVGFASRASAAAYVFRVLYFVFYAVGIGLLVWCNFRMFSRNVAKRQKENTRYLYRRQKVRRFFENKKQAWKDRKTYRYFKCPRCGQRMRAPRGKGKIRVTCSKCTNIFITKT
jgi:hypothetical protein